MATTRIYAGEEPLVGVSQRLSAPRLLLDRGEEFWQRQRSVIQRLRMSATPLEEVLVGVTMPEPAPPEVPHFPARSPQRRPCSQPE